MNEYFILLGVTKDRFGGYWGGGATIEDAKKKFRKAGGRTVTVVNRFTSALPFVAADREATEQEADAYVSKDGTLCWIRCERKVLAEREEVASMVGPTRRK